MVNNVNTKILIYAPSSVGIDNGTGTVYGHDIVYIPTYILNRMKSVAESKAGGDLFMHRKIGYRHKYFDYSGFNERYVQDYDKFRLERDRVEHLRVLRSIFRKLGYGDDLVCNIDLTFMMDVSYYLGKRLSKKNSNPHNLCIFTLECWPVNVHLCFPYKYFVDDIYLPLMNYFNNIFFRNNPEPTTWLIVPQFNLGLRLRMTISFLSRKRCKSNEVGFHIIATSKKTANSRKHEKNVITLKQFMLKTKYDPLNGDFPTQKLSIDHRA